MDRIRLKDKEFELFIPEEEIKDAIAKVAERIREDVKGTNPLFVGILNGAFMFTAELMRQLNEPYEITFARYSSYKGTSTTGVVREIMPVQADVKGRTLIMIEDIIDTGHTAKFLMDFINHNFKVKSVKFCSLLDKRVKREVEIDPDYHGLEVDDKFLVGYGLDYDGVYRNLPYIGYV